MDFNQHLNRLFGKTSEDLVVCEHNIQKWDQFISDYKALEERLKTMTDKTRHEIMVPIGGSDLAFMSGYIKHTNEVLVLLGDNYFVERSAKQAIDIVVRRITKCQEMIHNLNEEKTRLEKWLSFETQFANENKSEDFVEIVEQYDEQRERQWREDHRRRVKDHKMSEKLINKGTDALNVEERLESLEIQENKSEEQKHELKSILKKDIKREGSLGSDRSVCFDDNNSETDVKQSEDICNEIAFKNEVKERNVVQNTIESTLELKSSPKIVSRFRANRLKK